MGSPGNLIGWSTRCFRSDPGWISSREPIALPGSGRARVGVHWELWSFAAGGMSLHDVRRVGTILPAEAIGHGNNFGSIAVGKLADLQVLDANPLDDIRNTTSMWMCLVRGGIK